MSSDSNFNVGFWEFSTKLNFLMKSLRFLEYGLMFKDLGKEKIES